MIKSLGQFCYNHVVTRRRNSFSFLKAVKPETRHSILAVLFFMLALFFLLAGFNYAGPAGAWIYAGLDKLFGAGYAFIPFIAFLMGLAFLQPDQPYFVSYKFIGSGLVLISVLGIITIIFQITGLDLNGGVIGQILARSLIKFFGIYSLVFLSALTLIGALLMFEFRLKIWPRSINGFLKHFFTFLQKQLGLKSKPVELTSTEIAATDKALAGLTYPPAGGGKTFESAAVSAKKPDTEDKAKSAFPDLAAETGLKAAADFTPPPLSLLIGDRGKPAAGDIKANANIIKRTLANFGITVEMDEVSIGPSITRYALKPAEGVKLSRIVALQNDLSLALAAHPLRIEAPIPGRSLVGIEIPNTNKAIVGLSNLFQEKGFNDPGQPLLLTLGRDIAGRAHFTNLARAPHLLIAGATGSGKSVVIHTFLLSLLYRTSSERLRLLLIDPKRVELTLYNGIPHLLTPVITDPKKAILSLKWAAKEMERRYHTLSENEVRDIASYHKNIAEKNETAEKMPYIVIIIDELADIMATYPRELEAAIIRLAQMSRAVGIHLILSTQRPSVEVITGLIKANIPSRIALQVISQVDSRTILDMAGAEKLLGAGDMLYLAAEMSKPIRLQGPFVAEEEVKKVAAFLTRQQRPAGGATEAETIFADIAGQTGQGVFDPHTITDDETVEDDLLYPEAEEIVVQTGKASASFLQRKLKIGYARAARLLDYLEERGVVGPADGAKQRVVYAKRPEPDNNF